MKHPEFRRSNPYILWSKWPKRKPAQAPERLGGRMRVTRRGLLAGRAEFREAGDWYDVGPDCADQGQIIHSMLSDSVKNGAFCVRFSPQKHRNWRRAACRSEAFGTVNPLRLCDFPLFLVSRLSSLQAGRRKHHERKQVLPVKADTSMSGHKAAHDGWQVLGRFPRRTG